MVKQQRLAEARTVLAYAPELIDLVIAGTKSLVRCDFFDIAGAEVTHNRYLRIPKQTRDATWHSLVQPLIRKTNRPDRFQYGGGRGANSAGCGLGCLINRPKAAVAPAVMLLCAVSSQMQTDGAR